MKLTTRDLLWLILVCAVALAWLQSDRRRVAELREAMASRSAAIEDWKSSIAESLLRFKTAAIDPISEENKVAKGPPILSSKFEYLRAHNEMMAHLRNVGAVPPPTSTAFSVHPATAPPAQPANSSTNP